MLPESNLNGLPNLLLNSQFRPKLSFQLIFEHLHFRLNDTYFCIDKNIILKHNFKEFCPKLGFNKKPEIR